MQQRLYSTDRRGYTHFGNRGGLATLDGKRKKQVSVMALLVGGGAVYLWVVSRQEVPYSHRVHHILVSPEFEQALGKATFLQIKSQAAAAGKLLPEQHSAVGTVRQVGQRIAVVAASGRGGGYQEQMKTMEWEYAVIDSPEANAFVVPGGKVVVYSGLLRLMQTQDELAAVLAHETAHVLARHAAERMTVQELLSWFQMIAYWWFGIPIPGAALSLMFFLPNTRKQETEADMIGMQLAAQACFNPGAAASVFTKLGEVEKKMGGDNIPGFLRTHPLTSSRIDEVRKNLPNAEAQYEQAGCNTAQSFWGSGWAKPATRAPQPDEFRDGW